MAKNTAFGALCLPIAFGALFMIAGGCEKEKPVEGGGRHYVYDTLFVVQDALITSAIPNSSFGQSNELSVGTVIYVGGGGYVHKSLIKLPPLTQELDSHNVFVAELILYYKGSDSNRAIPVSAYQITQDWSESIVTWDTAPTHESAPFNSANVTATRLRINVLPIYDSGDSMFGIALGSLDGTEQVFYSSESASAPKVVFIAN